MADSTIVSPTPPGAGRSMDLCNDGDTALYTAWGTRGGAFYDNVITSSNSGTAGGLVGAGGGQAVGSSVASDYGDVHAYSVGTVAMGPPIGVQLHRPAVPFTTSHALRVLSAVLSWRLSTDAAANNPANTPVGWLSGFGLAFDGNGALINSPAVQGFCVSNEGGVPYFYSAGPGGTEHIDISAYCALPLWKENKVTFEIRNATFNSDASLTVRINDIIRFVRTWDASSVAALNAGKLPVLNGGSSGLVATFQHRVRGDIAGGTYLLWRDRTYYAGPDIVGL